LRGGFFEKKLSQGCLKKIRESSSTCLRGRVVREEALELVNVSFLFFTSFVLM
jgi:hypothetical protein